LLQRSVALADMAASASYSRSSLLYLRFTHAPPPWAFGLAFAVAGYSTCGFGLNLMKLSHLKQGNLSSTLQPTRWNRRGTPTEANAIWAAGFACNALGGSLNLCGLRFAAQSMLAPLSSSIALVANLLFASALIGERFSPYADALPYALIFAGNFVSVGSASHRAQESLTLPEIARLFRRPQFSCWLAVVAVSSSCLLLVRARIRRQIRLSGGEEFASPTLVARAGLCHALAAALLSVQTVLLGKASVLVLAGGVANALEPQFMALLGAWLGLAVFWVYTLNKLLAAHDAMFVVPAIEVSWSLLSLLSGGIFFSEYADMPPRQLAIFAFGVALNVTGVWRLTKRGEKSGKIG
jgi:Magnesium transporter NIPA